MHFNYSDIVLNGTYLNRGRYQFNANNSSQNPFYNPADPSGSATKLKTFLASNFPNPPSITSAVLLPQNANGLDPNFRNPFTEQLSAGATHQFASGIYVQGDFVSSHGRNMIVDQQTNLIPPAGQSIAQASQNGSFVTNDPRFSQITLYRNMGYTQYTALQTRIAYNRGNNLHLGVSYTLARTTSDTLADGIGGGLMVNPYNISIDDGPSDADRRHNLAFDGTYTLKYGIQVSGLFHYGSPLPWTLTSILDIYFRPEPRNSRRGSDFKDADVRFSKIFKIRERFSATLMWEVFNLFNSNNFYNYAGSMQSSAFGTPNSEQPKRAQQGGFRVDF